MRETKITAILLILSTILVLWWCWLKSLSNQEYNWEFPMDNQNIEWESNNRKFNRTRPVWSWDNQLSGLNMTWSIRSGRMPMFNMTWEVKELFDEMNELRKNGDFTWSMEIRKQLETKYPDLFSWAMRWPSWRNWEWRQNFQNQINE